MGASAKWERGSVVQDWGLAVVVAVIQLAGSSGANTHQSGVRSLDAFAYLLLLAGPIALGFRRLLPEPVLLVTLFAAIVYVLRDYGYGPIFLSLVIAFLTAAINGSRWRTYPLVAVGYLTMVWPLPALLGRGTGAWQAFGLLAWMGVLIAVAEGVRQRRAIVLARRQRAEAARRDEQAQQARAASEERLAIARELHDVLAHSLSLINVQSSVALELFDRKPQQAAAALATIKTTSKEALTEVHTLLHAIRSGASVAPVEEYSDSVAAAPDSPPPAPQPAPPPRPAPRAPAPSLDDLDTLLERTRATGLTVDTKIIGTPKKLPSVMDVAAARIIQESLTNVVRHAPGAAALITLRYTAESVDITVDNTRPTGPAVRSGAGGNGIIGMRERAHALGGALTAGPRPSGGFRVAARLPARPVGDAPPAASEPPNDREATA
ncbi:sensor histidine kinase [Nocardia asteroides]|uniref:histidine kinase n=1 Tax=Nocardia asteroides NBRC 15531 TaxID=1110697 RepID=U5E509_NOCAS|nr:histidine kinase [Nocardia asteroides]UGT48161.1 two-component sensor histidine kinase [Nocardia asteroides]GAD84642.1 putative two-component histidine kinase [Nocardia asteroides NBRC 15531]SFN70642.1 Signal transduction histidine kinase [Nocardia asteroides]VEG32851.1 Sensor histidine kinase desK [Nocardia asteroides]